MNIKNIKRNLVLSQLVLLVTAVLLGSQLRNQWKEYHSTHDTRLLNPAVSRPGTTPNVADTPKAVPNYAAIVDNHLFSADRTNLVPLEPVAESTKTVPKPILMGTLQLDEEEFALMVSETQRENTNYKRLKVGESLDGYTLVKIMDQKVMMKTDDKDDKEVEVRLNEPSKMVAREIPPSASKAPAPAGQVTSVGSGPSTTASSTSGVAKPQELPKGAIPEGTIVNGRRKKLVPSPFGMMETWEEVK